MLSVLNSTYTFAMIPCEAGQTYFAFACAFSCLTEKLIILENCQDAMFVTEALCTNKIVKNFFIERAIKGFGIVAHLL